jgi:glycosyltransferase involved in cell wall biosynthesis
MNLKGDFMNQPLVSIVMPVYRVEKYIEESIKSIVEQTYTNIELIVVDDEGDDKSIEIAEYILKNSNIDYKIVREKNKGLPGARNYGVEFAKGEYVCFIDSDDCISNNHVEDLIKILKTHNLDVCFSDFEYTNESNRKGKNMDSFSEKIYKKDELLNAFSTRKIKIHCCSLCIKKSLFLEYKFNEKLRYGEDVEFMWRLFSGQDYIGRSMVSSYKYLIRSNSIMSTYSYDKDKVFVEEFKKSMKTLMEKYPENKKIYIVAYYRNIFGWLHALSKKTTYIQFLEAIQMIDKMKLIQNLKRNKDFKISILVGIFKTSDKIFYNIMRKI